MYLKALEIQGFKSFPDKVRLEFEKEVTAIVGPNGSGKSNISDAISWVLGEQSSKALRGSKMEDVIFGGTPERGRMGFAQVSLVLDNESGTFRAEPGELTVTRRYYRSGESEYFINKKSVRLKDVNGLFMDTGLGRDGYSMIGQGRVDEILSAKSTDRREVFEEAAGISKFRYRREEAQRKLEKTEESLVRINDKISELELTVEPLREQANVARRYLVLRDELRGLEISLWMESLHRLAEHTAKLREEYEDAGNRLENARAELRRLYENAEGFAEKLREREENAEKLRGEISAVENLAAGSESELAVLKANIKSNGENLERVLHEIDELGEKEKDLSAQIGQRRTKAEELNAKISEISQECGRLIEEADIAGGEAGENEKELNSLLAAAAGEESEAAAARARAEALKSSGEEMLVRAASAAEELEKFALRVDTERVELEKKTSELVDKKEKAAEAENRISGFRVRLKNRTDRLAELNSGHRELQMEENRVTSRLSLLRDMKKEYEGFSRAVKTVMQEKRGGRLKNIHGTVAELLHVPDEYAVAIETALGASVQHIVVDREEDGKAAINLLKQRDAGRATFLPLSAVKGSELGDMRILSEPGIIGLASRLASYDERYAGIVRSLLGRVLIAENLERAIAVSRSCGGRVKIVTLDGQVMNAGGSMTGGSAVRSVGIISRSNELERLAKREKELAEKAKELSAQSAEAERGRAEAAYELELAENELREKQDEILALSTELSQRKVLLESMEERCGSLASGADEAKNLAGKNSGELEAALSLTSEHEDRAAEMRLRAEKLQSGRMEQKKRLDELTHRLSELKTEEASLKSERESTLRSASEWESLLAAQTSERERKNAITAELRRHADELEEQAKALEEKAASYRALASEGRTKLEEALSEKLEAERSRGLNEKKTQEKNSEIIELERAYAKIEQRKLSADMEEKQIVDKLWDTYELSRSAAERQRQELESVSKANKRAGELRREIASLGTPNIGAIDEFERVNERYTYLTDQRDDITGAKAGLERIVADVTKEMEEVFTREFKSIDENFRVTFRELFGGGSARLELEDETDVLNCGVEIRVQPPGKTEKTLTLLSGGERAFVAIALYFAIMKVRPTPFCVLDEIESALDEKNVARFADYLRKVCGNTQFLVITHRRGSMERADVLYGVTMQKGVSKVLSIDLDEALKKY